MNLSMPSSTPPIALAIDALKPTYSHGLAARGKPPVGAGDAFEQILVRQILREAKVGGESGGSLTQQSVCSDMVVDAVSQAVCKGQGMGLQKALLRQMESLKPHHASSESSTDPS